MTTGATMTEQQLQEILDGGSRSDPLMADAVIGGLVAEVRRLQDALQETWSDGFAHGEQSNADALVLLRAEVVRLRASIESERR